MGSKPSQTHTNPLSTDSEADKVLVVIEEFSASLTAAGYAASTVKEKRNLLADFQRWTKAKKVARVDLDEAVNARFLKYRRRLGKCARSNARTLDDLLMWWRGEPEEQIFARGTATPACSGVERDYDEYLEQERGLASATRDNYGPLVRRFLVDRFGEGPVCLDQLSAGDVTGFIERHAHEGSLGRRKLLATALRSFLRFLLQRGDVANDLASAVPCVAGWRLASLPKGLDPKQVDRLLRACDLTTTTGRRNHAILLLLARLGLRAGEVVALNLDDIDWDSGTLVINGKGQRRARLPLPPDVGEAIVAYLRGGRPDCSNRRVFVRLRAPHRGFSSSAAIGTIVCRGLAQAGVDSPRKGAHILRHALATQMLRRGASLGEIGDVLRHRHPDTTMIYAKVDLDALRPLARPWPGGAA